MSEKKVFSFRGEIIRCVYKSDGFSVYGVDVNKRKYPDLKQNSYNNVSIVGELPDLSIGIEYDITALETNSKNGINYKVINIVREAPKSTEEIRNFLVEIITERQADILLDVYPNIIEIVKNNECDKIDLSKLKGIKEKTFDKIKNKIIENFALMDIIVEFKGILSMSMIKRIYDKYTSIEVLKDKLKKEPYKTLTQISRVGFKSADSLIIQMQKDNIIDFDYNVKTSVDRCLACIVYLLQENEQNGNTKMNMVELRKEAIKLVPECINEFPNAIRDEIIYYNKDNLCIALKKTYDNEKKIAEAIKYGLSIDKVWDFNWKQYQDKGEFPLSDEQIELLHSVCENNIVIMTGGGGCGKSYSVQMFIQMLKDENKSFILATPTGKSAKVLKDFSGVEAKTIHRALMYNPQTGWGFNNDNKIQCDVFLIDELSMVSVELMSHVIDAINFDKTKLVMIGDSNQLPSVQCGNLLHDFINSQKIPMVRLTKVFRYGTGGILTVATDVVNGNNYFKNNKNKMIAIGEDNGYTFINSDDSSIVNNVLMLYKKLITDGVNDTVYKPEDIAVLTAYNKGDYGAITLNNHLQKIANAKFNSGKQIKYGDTVYCENDIVMQKVNDYSIDVYNESDDDGDDKTTCFVANGETSKIIKIENDYMVCDFDDTLVKYKKDRLFNLSLAYSYSIHKSQGSTVKVAIVVTPRSHVYMNSMNLLYVAITRASDKVFHFGTPSTINMAMKKKENYNRNTFMKDFLKE